MNEPILEAYYKPKRDKIRKVPGTRSVSSTIVSTQGFKDGAALLVDGAFLSAAF